ncbi:MAG: thioredoxin family protein [Sulfurovaceae bacterium]|nr:thioredoxin family protein [Sulfurovaceae bacterium]
MKKILSSLLFLGATSFADTPMLQATPYSEVQPTIGKGQPVFLEIGSDHCHSCQEMGKMLYIVKQKHPSYNLNFINISEDRDIAIQLKVMMIPTQIIYDTNGSEVFRHVGKLEQKELDEVFKEAGFVDINSSSSKK